MEEKLFTGELTGAAALLAEIETSGTIEPEENSKLFYSLYYNYLVLDVDSAERYHADDSVALYDLSQLCPTEHGSCVYQARALFNTIYGSNVIYNDCDQYSGARMAAAQEKRKKERGETVVWDVGLFPNPNYGNFVIISVCPKTMCLDGKLQFRGMSKKMIVRFTAVNERSFFLT